MAIRELSPGVSTCPKSEFLENFVTSSFGIWLVVWNHGILWLSTYIYIYIGNFIIPTDFHSFQRGRFTTNQESLGDIGRFCLGMIWISSNFRIDLPCNEALRPPKTRIYSHRSNLQRLRFHAISTRGSENGSNEASGSVQDKFHMWYFRHEKWKEP